MKKILFFLLITAANFSFSQNWETVVVLPGKSPIKQIEVVSENNIYVSSQYYKLYNWNGSKWSSVGNFNPGYNGYFSYKSDTEVYATHNTYLNGKNENEYNYIAKWDGNSWSNFGNFNQPKQIYNFKIRSDSEIYAVGAFDDLEGYRWRPVAKYNGTSWNVLGLNNQFAGTYSANNSLWVNNENDIYSKHDNYRSNGNKFVKHWDGNSWTVLNNTNLDEVDGVDRIYVVNENEIYINSWNKNQDFGVIGFWDGNYWRILGDIQTDLNTGGFYGSLDFVYVNANEIYAFGSALRNRFDYTYQVAVWNGTKWSTLGDLQANNPVISGFYKNGFLYVGGSFTEGNKTLIKKIDTQKILSTENFNTSKVITTFPNPVTHICYFDKKYPNIKVYSILGKLISEESNVNSVDFSNLKEGIYLLKLKTLNGKYYFKKIIKK